MLFEYIHILYMYILYIKGINMITNLAGYDNSSNLRTSLSKARSLIRLFLNTQQLDEILEFIILQNNLLSQFYYPGNIYI